MFNFLCYVVLSHLANLINYQSHLSYIWNKAHNVRDVDNVTTDDV